MLFSTQQLKEIRQSVNIERIIGETVDLKASGSYLKGKCPFHDEKTPSFFVYPEKNYFICYGCGEKGDLFDYLMKTEGLSFGEAVKKAADIAGIKLQNLSPEEEKKQQKHNQHIQTLLNINRDAAAFFREILLLPSGIPAKNYLSTRKLNNNIIEEFMLGFAPDSWNMFTDFVNEQHNLNAAVEIGLIKQGKNGSYYDFFRNRVMFPIIDTNGKVRGFSGRVIDPESKEGKYVNSPESPIFHKRKAVFGLKQAVSSIRKNDFCIITEGNIDVLTMHQYGFTNTVAPLGTALTGDQLEIIKRYTKNMILLFDGDKAGKKASLKAVPLLIEHKINAKIAFLPQKHDPDSFLTEYGTKEMQSLLNKALPSVDAFLSANLPDHTASVQDKLVSLASLNEIWKLMTDSEQDAYAEQIALMLQINVSDVKQTINSYIKKPTLEHLKHKQTISENQKNKKLTKEETAEIHSLLHIAVLYEKYNEVLPELGNISSNLFFSMYARDLFRNLSETKYSDDQSWAELLTPELKKKKKELEISLSDVIHPEETLREIINSLKVNEIKRKTRLLDLEIYEARKINDNDKVNNLLIEKLNLQKQRINLQQQETR